MVIMVVSARQLVKTLTATCCRRRPCHRSITTTSQQDASAASSASSHLVHLSDRIYTENPVLYKCLRPPCSTFQPLVVEGDTKDEENGISDWNEVLDTVQGMRVVPEMADQLSGAIYMHALMQEDITCKCIRVSDHMDILSR